MTNIAQCDSNDSFGVKRQRAVKRYNLSVPEEIYNEVQKIAEENGSTTVDLLRRYIKLGLIASQEGNTLILSNEKGSRELMIL